MFLPHHALRRVALTVYVQNDVTQQKYRRHCHNTPVEFPLSVGVGGVDGLVGV